MTQSTRRPLARPLALALAAMLAALPAPERPLAEARPASEQRVGDENHPKILNQFGGEVRDEALRAYVDRIGRRLVEVTDEAGEPWTFTVLDTPVVNAFALPGGYVYVSRGLIALANDEAELAGVIGHEIGHVVASHGASRNERAGWAQLGLAVGTIVGAVVGIPGETLQVLNQLGAAGAQGLIASYSREQELEADRLGVECLAKAGYDPDAQADFLASLKNETALQATIAGQAYNPNRVDFFASHPATGERVRKAARLAEQYDTEERTPRFRKRFYEAIDGMIYGDSPAQGMVRGGRFVHPELRFAFEAPEGFRIQNAAANVTMAGPQGAGIVFDGDQGRRQDPEAYIARTWAPAIARQARVGQLSGMKRGKIGGLDAAFATMPVETQQGVRILRLTAIRDGDAIWRFMGVQPQGEDRLGAVMDRAAESFRNLSAEEASAFKPQRIKVHEVRAGETPASLARRAAFGDRAEERFRVLNGLAPSGELREGQKVKLVVE